jgi:hypothetical protein
MLLTVNVLNYAFDLTMRSKPNGVYKQQLGLSLNIGRAMAQAVSRRPLTAEARVRSRVTPCGICGGQSGTGTGFSPRVLRFSPVNFVPPVLHYTEKN